jgi:hypothetical protein
LNPFRALAWFFKNSAQSTQMLVEIRDELAGSSNRSTQMLAEIREGIANLTDVVNRNLQDKSATDQSIQLLRDIGAGIVNLADVVVCTSVEARSIHHDDQLRIAELLEAARQPPPAPSPVPAHSFDRSAAFSRGASKRREIACANDLASYADAFEGLTPYSGVPAPGFYPNWTGAMIDAKFKEWAGMKRDRAGGVFVQTQLPKVVEGEHWFENVNWLEAAREANGRCVMVSLGACFGAQAVGAYRVLQMINPMPCKLVAVEPEPDNQKWLRQHFLDNGIDPDNHWFVGSAISDTRQPVFFPVGAPGTGAQNCFSTNEPGAREAYVAALASSDQRDEALRNLLMFNTTGLTKNLTDDGKFKAEIKLVSAVTLDDILSPFDFVDYIEADIQQSEILVIPPFMGLLRKKVRRIHVGTHGKDVHEELARLFRDEGWEIIFDYAPNMYFETPYGNFLTNDGVLTVRNPDL